MKKTIQYSFKASLPVFAGYVVLGIGFGLLLASHGYPAWWALLMSVTIFAGTMQYVGISLMASGAGLVTTAITALLLQARHLFYGISMLDKYRGTGKMKPYLIFALSDETYSLVVSPNLPEGVILKKYYFFVSLFDQCYWILGSVIGAVVGNTLTFNTAGVDFSMTALFVVVFVEQWESTKQHFPALLGLGSALVCLLIFGASNFMVPTMICITAGLFLMRPVIEKKKEGDAHES